MIALISGGLNVLSALGIFTWTRPLASWSTSYGTSFSSSWTSECFRPMKRLMENTVFSGFVIACRRATCPTRRSPSLVKATTDGVVRPPSELGITTGSPPSMTATTEFVVPRSIPMTLPMCSSARSVSVDRAMR
jgi:hypothetical protein